MNLKTFRAHSKAGVLIVETELGLVNRSRSTYDTFETRPGWVPLASIFQLDVREWKQKYPNEILEDTDQNLLDFGCWFEEGNLTQFTAPAHAWRSEVRATLPPQKPKHSSCKV